MSVNEPVLAVVIITRNEAKHIRDCLESVSQVAAAFPGAPVVLVDSDSSDDTVAIAAGYPLTVFRYRGPVLTAAAGRRIGFEQVRARYVLFVDGDCCIDAAWVKSAVALLDQSPNVALMSGRRREVLAAESAVAAQRESEAPVDGYGIGGNALFRSTALRQVGNFNPFLPALEEMELQGRIEAAGYRMILTPTVMFTHYTYPQESLRSLRHLVHRGRVAAIGQLLRLSVRQGRLGVYVRQFNRYLLMLVYILGFAPIPLLAGRWGAVAWVGIGAIAFLYLALRRRSFKSAAYLVALWITGAVGILRSFRQALPNPDSFVAQVERLA